jgi:hypothetical protein
MNLDLVHDALTELQQLRDSLAIAYVVDRISEVDAYVLYECLRETGPVERLDVVLWATGGSVDAARGIALLLHEYCTELRILVPDNAQSAGTLLCLSAHALTVGPLARFGPIDPHLTAGARTDGGPGPISAEDVRVLPELAQAWFGVDATTAAAQSLAMVSQRLFPSSLGAFFRADRNIRRIARELVAIQLPHLDEQHHTRLVDQLVSGYDSHGYVITRADAAQLGLNVSFASAREEQLMWQCTEPLRRWYLRSAPETDLPRGVVASGAGFRAQHVEADGSPANPEPIGGWQVERRSLAHALPVGVSC